jgi:hypothetical protein
MAKPVDLELNESEARMLSAFVRLLERDGKEPTLRKLAAECGYADQSGARYQRQQLERRGFMRPPTPPAITESGRLALRKHQRASR